jgi:hypothetical protein
VAINGGKEVRKEANMKLYKSSSIEVIFYLKYQVSLLSGVVGWMVGEKLNLKLTKSSWNWNWG